MAKVANKQQNKKRGGRRTTHRRHHRHHQRGSGWTDLVDAKHMISPGNQTHQPYMPGICKDCAGTPMPTDWIPSYTPKGLPGWGGGGSNRSRRRSYRHSHRGGVAPFPGAFKGTPIQLKYPVGSQQGGRWGSFPGLGPPNPVNAVGATSYAPIGRVPCEVGTTDALNLNPDGIQTMSTAVPSVKGWTPFRGGGCPCSAAAAFRGGRRTRRTRRTQRGGVQVGEFDAMRYYAPTAGYDNTPLMPQVQNNPGILMQVGYPARHFNMACMKTN